MLAYERFAQLLARNGARTAFGVLGDGNMHWVVAFAGQPGCRWYPAWHEAGATWMANGWAAVTGEVGIATVTMGPGLAQALPALAAVRRNRGRVLVVTAALPETVPPHAQYAPQRTLVEGAGGRYLSVTDPDSLAATTLAALASAARGVATVLAVDLSVFGAEVAPECEATASPAVRQTESGSLDHAAAVIGRAKRPLVLLGRGVTESGCRDLAVDLGRRLGAVLGTTVGGRTALPDEPFDLGVLGMMASPTARDIVDAADLVLVLGAALDRYNTDDGRLGSGARMVRVDRRPGDELWSPSAETIDLTGELPTVLARLAARLPATAAVGLRTPNTRTALQAERARQQVLAERPADDGPNPWAVIRELDRELPNNVHVVVGIGHFWYFVAPHLSAETGRTFHFTTGFACIGQAVPTGVGAALASADAGQERDVVVIEGDGSAVMNVQELHTAVRLGASLLVLILNNGAYGSEYHKLALAQLDVAPSEFAVVPFDFVSVAHAMGATTRSARTIAELRTAIRELLPMRGVRVIDAAISRTTMSETYLRLHAGGSAAAQ